MLIDLVRKVIDDRDSVKVLTTVDEEGLHSIAVGSMYCPDKDTVAFASRYMVRSFRSLWNAQKNGGEVSILAVRIPQNGGKAESFEVTCSVRSFQFKGQAVDEMRQREGGGFSGVWLLNPESTICQSPGPCAGRLMDLVISTQDIEAREIGGSHHGMKSQEILSPIDTGTERVQLDIHHYEPGGHTDPSSHENFEQIYYVISGQGRVLVGEVEQQIKPGSLVYIPRREKHKVENTGEQELVILFIQARLDPEEPGTETQDSG